MDLGLTVSKTIKIIERIVENDTKNLPNFTLLAR